MSDDNSDTTTVEAAAGELADAINAEDAIVEEVAEEVAETTPVVEAVENAEDAAGDAAETVEEAVTEAVQANPDLSDEHVGLVYSRVLDHLRTDGHIPDETPAVVAEEAIVEDVTPRSSHWASRPLFRRKGNQ